MKPSTFNYIIPTEDKSIIYNGISEKFFFVSNENIDRIKTILDNPDLHIDTFQAFIEKMKNEGFILDNETDENKNLKEKYLSKRSAKSYQLMILPTYQCNLRCWYCTQRHSEMWMSEETVKRIKKNILRAIESSGIDSLTINWFGGEPLLAYDIILDINSYALELCEKSGIGFFSDITTNGTLLNETRIAELYRKGIKRYQITIDGIKSEHDNIKKLNNCSAYERTLRNVSEIAKHAQCVLRFNYTHKNLKPTEIVSELDNRLSAEIRKNIIFSVHQVWQENRAKIDYSKVKSLYLEAQNANLTPKPALNDMCYADNKYFFCIFPNGKVGKCDNSDPNEVPGEILEDGSIYWPENLNYDIPAFEHPDAECKTCRYIPVCWGPCAPKRKDMLQKFNKIKCLFGDKDTTMRGNIINRIISFHSMSGIPIPDKLQVTT